VPGRVGCFSFNGNKTITTGGGGMVVTADVELAAHVRHLSTQARIAGSDYEHDAIGFNYRMTNIAAAVGVAQLGRLPELLAAKRAIAARYRDAFASQRQVTGPPEAGWASSSSWLSTVELATPELRDRVRALLREGGIDARPVWRPVHQQKPYHGAPLLGSGRVADDIGARWLSLPSSASLTEGDQARVIDIVAGAMGS
jgi:dTDP-4-amino-4,6-dideoxygalactose transaminase